MNIPTLRYCLEEATPLTEYTVRFIFNSLGIAASPTEGDDFQFYYGAQPPENTSAVVIQPKTDDVVWQDLVDGKVEADALGSVIPFDIVNGIAALLTDRVNANLSREHYDPHYNLKAPQSFQWQAGITAVPVVNLYVNLLGEVLKKQFGIAGIPLFPEGKRIAIGLSHDVDRLQRAGVIKALLHLRYARMDSTVKKESLVDGIRAALLGTNDDDFTLFRRLMQTERDHGFVTTYYFNALPLASTQHAVVDILYDIDHDNFRSLFRDLKAQGFEIGLHASYNAYHSAENFIAQKKRLESIAETTVKGQRHHYWHVGPEVNRTLAYHEDAGFLYDTSISFEDELGFRRSSALPYYPWSEERGRALKVMQLPVFCMDGHAFYAPGMTVDRAMAQISGVIDTIKQVGGVGIVDWHSDTSNPETALFSRWGEAYYALLDVLAADSEIWTTSLENLYEWFAEREQKLDAAAV